jgi:hypothetical protein
MNEGSVFLLDPFRESDYSEGRTSQHPLWECNHRVFCPTFCPTFFSEDQDMTVLLQRRFRLPALAAAFAAMFLAGPILMVDHNADGATAKTQPKKSSSLYAQAVLADCPAAYWRLGEKPGASVAVDATNHKHNGQYHNRPRLGLPGAILHDKDTAMGLDGPKTKSYVEVPCNDVFSVGKSGHGLTVEVWMKPSVLNFTGENKNLKNPYFHWLGKGQKNEFEWGFRFYSQKSDRPNRISAYIWNRKGAEGAGAYFQERLSTTT